VLLESFDAIPAKDKPDLERPETAAQTQMPVSEINDGASIFSMNKNVEIKRLCLTCIPLFCAEENGCHI